MDELESNREMKKEKKRMKDGDEKGDKTERCFKDYRIKKGAKTP